MALRRRIRIIGVVSGSQVFSSSVSRPSSFGDAPRGAKRECRSLGVVASHEFAGLGLSGSLRARSYFS
jgi:hypothetical protein